MQQTAPIPGKNNTVAVYKIYQPVSRAVARAMVLNGDLPERMYVTTAAGVLVLQVKKENTRQGE